MAKMIKCPTCGTQIEVPPGASGQIVKCPGCGKGLKLVAKPKPGAPGGAGAAQQSGGAGLGGSPGGSVAGSSVSAMTFVGETPAIDRPGPALDDLPSLESNCAVCGRPTDPNDLIEDNGRLICMDCIKGARSGMARPEGGADLIDFKPSALPAKRGKLINFSPSLVVGVLAALVFATAWICLEIGLVEKPVGTLTASTVRAGTTGGGAAGGRNGVVAPAPDPDQEPTPGAPTDSATTAPDESTGATGITAPTDATASAAAPAPVPPSDSTDPGATPTTPPADGTSPGAATTTPNTAVAAVPNPDTDTIFTDGPAGAAPPKDGAAPGAADPGAGAAVAAPADIPAPAPAVQSSDPLQRGIERLTARDYAKATADLDTARLRYVVGKLPRAGMPLTPQQQLTLEGLAACYIGMGRIDAARGSLDTAYRHNVRTRSLILNSAIYMLSGQRQLNSMVEAAELVRQHMGHQQNDEYAADIFGTLVNKIAGMANAPKAKVDAWWTFHDNYIDQLAARGDVGQPGKLKWGVDWLPAEDVKTYRSVRGMTNATAGVSAAAKEVELAAQRVRTADATLKKAEAERQKGQAADVVGAQSQLDAANAALVKAQQSLELANAAVNTKKPRWLDTSECEPVIPQQVVAP